MIDIDLEPIRKALSELSATCEACLQQFAKTISDIADIIIDGHLDELISSIVTEVLSKTTKPDINYNKKTVNKIYKVYNSPCYKVQPKARSNCR